MNYIFYSVQKSLRLTGDLKDLFELSSKTTWKRRVTKSCWRSSRHSLPSGRWYIVASPTWYPLLSDDVRRALFNFLENVLGSKKFNYRDVNSYLD